LVSSNDSLKAIVEKRRLAVDGLVSLCKVLPETDSVLVRASRRGLDKMAPLHLDKQSVADAVILEAARQFCIDNADAVDLNLVTVNTSDFCSPKDHRKPHEDLDLPRSLKFSIDIQSSLGKLLPSGLSTTEVQALSRSALCPYCEADALIDAGWARSPMGGLTWHLRCTECSGWVDTYESACD
jgi:hypothetical protein